MEFVYIADLGTCVKIGYSTNVENRIKQIEAVKKTEVQNLYFTKAECPIERLLHHLFTPFRIEGEYYAVSFIEVKEKLNDLIKSPETYHDLNIFRSKQQQVAKDKYLKEKVDTVALRMPKGKKELVQAHAEARKESVNGFINRAIDNQIKQDQEDAGA